MKNITIYSLLILLLSAASCSKTTYPAEVNYVSEEAVEGTISLSATGYAHTPFEAGRKAEMNAFSTILFKGVPGSQQLRPIIENETEFRQKHPDFDKTFFTNDKYKEFILSSNGTEQQLVKNNYKVSRTLKVNLRALRVHLEQKGAIRKFGL